MKKSMNKIRVCHLTSVHPCTDNRIFHKECRTLLEAGYDVSLVAPGVETHERNGIKVYGVPAHRNRLRRVFVTAFIHVLRTAKKVDADIYHFHDPELIPVGLILRFIGKRVIIDVHENNAAAILSRAYVKSRLAKVVLSKGIRFLEQASVHYFSAIITARPDISEIFKKRHPYTLHNFPILPVFEEIEAVDVIKTKPAVIYVGGMTEVRGIKELIQAFERTENAELWLLGSFGTKAFENECRSLKGWENVRLLGQVEATEIFGYIKKADIGIVTFLPVPNHVTTLATKPFEYMACGLPMVMSNFSYWKEFFGESSLYVDPSDSGEIAETIKRLLADKALMTSMGSRNLELTQREYNWQKESEVLLDAYRHAWDKE